MLEGEEIAYKFTPKYVLRAGQTVTVRGFGRAGGQSGGSVATSGRGNGRSNHIGDGMCDGAGEADLAWGME